MKFKTVLTTLALVGCLGATMPASAQEKPASLGLGIFTFTSGPAAAYGMPGKNAADILLCVEAMALALRDGFETLVIASSDRDFSYLAEHLREAGKRVVGIGSPMAAASFQAACSHFHSVTQANVTVIAPPAVGETDVDRVCAVVRSGGQAGVPIAALGPALPQHGVKIAETPEKTWRAWLTARATVFALDPKGPTARVRLKA